MQPDHFELHYEGNATENHSMDISVTRDVLSALDILVQRVSKKQIKMKILSSMSKLSKKVVLLLNWLSWVVSK
ncbi:hypothetical protein [Vibrio tapetis]|uniref:Uncharacterized protein n=2 Tax=Vibrio tapetis TaxID=52443 RepID=A0A2N8ZHU8_9VIBR|nr:hypothetical protein [Vibrio tapetis]ACB99671.1 conserved protein [Vibrio tapetis]SON51468.1 conserved protein of unknown function [Vibrio tapetis subsp. tapetis]SON53530.1 conserved protein of unknown function [Vibrio tapetis subsp. tapetis]